LKIKLRIAVFFCSKILWFWKETFNSFKKNCPIY